ncbi:MAG: hypothetical protein ACI81V_000993 [Lentimonas sp.]|jgi:hypothetical protein
MALCLLLLLAVSVLVKVETRRSAIARQRLQAQQSARLALLLAVGQLQQHAGPDQRISARGEILGQPGQEFWTGIWDSADPTVPPTWLVSWQNQSQTAASSSRMRLVGPGSVGPSPGQFVEVPALELPASTHTGRIEIAWWTSDEGVKASADGYPTDPLATPNYTHSHTPHNWQVLLSDSPALEEIFLDYNRTAENAATSLQPVWSLQQLLALKEFRDPLQRQLSGENVFHCVSPFSYGVLASVVPHTAEASDTGLLQDLSLFPGRISAGLVEVIESAASTAHSQATKTATTAQLQHSTPLRGLDQIGPLSPGQIASPVTPILSNLLLAFTLRSESPYSSNPNFYLRMRFFCELWNPYTSSLEMKNTTGGPLQLELEINGLPEVTATNTSGSGASSAPVALQELLKDPTNTNGAMVLRLQTDPADAWLPGQSRNWTGVEASSANGPSPYDSILTDQKAWDSADHNLGGSTGIDTGIPRISGDIRHTSSGDHELQIRLYLVDPENGTRQRLNQLDKLRYEPVSTRPSGYSSDHSGSTFGYHVLLRGPEMSNYDPQYFRGRWLYDHDPRNPNPPLPDDWQLDNDPELGSGSAYVPVKNGISPLPLPSPAEINETNNTLNTVVFRRLLDRSHGTVASGSTFNKIWQDAPLFELLRERPLALAGLQHLYFHNERPFKVGNSWGAAGAINTLAWFDRFYFSGFARIDRPAEYNPALGLPNPTLRPYQLDDPERTLRELQALSPSDASGASTLAAHLLVNNRFNINSTSVAGWKAILGGLNLNDWTSLHYPEDRSDGTQLTTQQNTHARTFARFGTSLAETYHAPATPELNDSETVAPSAYYRRGARRFDASEIEQLAREIVQRIKARGTPFDSMQQFLSAEPATSQSLLEHAIASAFSSDQRQHWDHSWETEGVRSAQSEHLEIDHFSPGFLTQADIMAAIGPMLAPRSDTFKIRARAQTYSPQGDLSGSACIEAILQRTPEAIDHYPTNNPGAVRRFKILSTRWLSPQEL